MKSSKINFNSKSKLSRISENVNIPSEPETLNIINHELKVLPTSFRLRSIDIERFEDVLKKINDINESHPFNKTFLIRGLIMLATEIKSEKLLEYIRKSI